jgi:hypothetical protein
MSGILVALPGIVSAVKDTIDDLHTSEEERRAADLEVRKLDQQLLTGQQEINKVEAAHASVFVAGWRPAVGWVCAGSLALYYIPKALALTSMWVYAAGRVIWAWNGQGDMPALPVYPDFGIADILGLTASLLGTASLRTVEKVKDVAASAPLTPFRLPGLGRKNPGDVEAP